jgi:hypothetical protein
MTQQITQIANMMKLIKAPKTAIPVRPVFPIEGRLEELRVRERELTARIIELEPLSTKNPSATDDGPKIEAAARVLIKAEAKPIKSGNLKDLLHERAVVQRSLELGNEMLTELRAAWAAQVFSEHNATYRAAYRKKALAVAALRAAERECQALQARFAWPPAALSCAKIGLGVALGMNNAGPVHTFMQAAVKDGLVKKEEIENV